MNYTNKNVAVSCKRYPPSLPYIIIVQTCGKRWDLPKFVDVLSVNLGFSRLLIYIYICLYTRKHYLPKQCVHTEGFLRKELRPVLDRGTHSGPRHFPCKFPHKMTFVTHPCAFRLPKLAQNVGLSKNLGHSIFPVEFRIKWLL